jgi:pimeloyl-ACP methyl ester carboxylesterase
MVPGSLPLGLRWPGHFGPAERRIYGCYHPAQGTTERNMAVILCYPLGHEYMRAHRAYLHLANRLAAAGFHVGRFEYHGTGDSPGSEDELTFENLLDDISVTIEESRRVARVRHVTLIGLRLGAALAMLAAVRRGDISSLVFWDPVVNGRAFLDYLKSQHQERLWRYFFDRPELMAPGDHPTELLGFRTNERLLHDLATLDLLAITTKPARAALVVDSQGDAAIAQLDRHLNDLTVQATFQHLPGFSIWTEDVDKGLVPAGAIQSIVTWMVGMDT